MMGVGRQSKMVTRISPNEERVKNRVESLAEMENVTDCIPAISGSLLRKVDPLLRREKGP